MRSPEPRTLPLKPVGSAPEKLLLPAWKNDIAARLAAQSGEMLHHTHKIIDGRFWQPVAVEAYSPRGKSQLPACMMKVADRAEAGRPVTTDAASPHTSTMLASCGLLRHSISPDGLARRTVVTFFHAGSFCRRLQASAMVWLQQTYNSQAISRLHTENLVVSMVCINRAADATGAACRGMRMRTGVCVHRSSAHLPESPLLLMSKDVRFPKSPMQLGRAPATQALALGYRAPGLTSPFSMRQHACVAKGDITTIWPAGEVDKFMPEHRIRPM